MHVFLLFVFVFFVIFIIIFIIFVVVFLVGTFQVRTFLVRCTAHADPAAAVTTLMILLAGRWLRWAAAATDTHGGVTHLPN